MDHHFEDSAGKDGRDICMEDEDNACTLHSYRESRVPTDLSTAADATDCHFPSQQPRCNFCVILLTGPPNTRAFHLMHCLLTHVWHADVLIVALD